MDQAVTDSWLTFDLGEVTRRFESRSPWGAQAQDLEREVRRMLRLRHEYPDQPVSPSPIVDEYWHALILHTTIYREYCSQAFGQFVEHAPGSEGDRPRETYLSQLRNTRRLYREHFGEEPGHMWFDGVAEATVPVQYQRPHRLHLETTNHCNLRCEHCYPASAPENEHHDLVTILDVIDNAASAGIAKITLTGGELLTRPDWKTVIRHALRACDNVYFISNGVGLTDDVLDWLTRERVHAAARASLRWPPRPRPVELGVAISMDGLESNGLVRKTARGNGVKYTLLLSRIHSVVAHGLHVTVNTTLTNEQSASELPEMYRLIDDIGIDRWQIDQAYASGRFPSSDLFDPQLGWLETAKDGYEFIVREYLKNYPTLPAWRLEIVQVFRFDSLGMGFMPATGLDEHPCSYQFGSLIVEGGNQLRFCPSLRNAAVGAVTSADFASVLDADDTFREFAGGSIRDLPCKDCRYSLLFHGGCRANSLSYSGKMWARDPICCSLSPFVEDRIVPLLPDHMKQSFAASVTSGTRPDERTSATSRRKLLPISPASR